MPIISKLNRLKESELDLMMEKVKSISWNLLLENGNLIWTYRRPFDSLIKPIIDSEKAESEIELNEIWLRIVDNVRTVFENQNEYIYIPAISLSEV